MQIQKITLAIISTFVLCNLYAENTNKGKAIVENMLQKFYDPRNGNATNEQFNWKIIFNAIDQYKLNPAALRHKNGHSLLMLAIIRNRDAYSSGFDKMAEDSFNAVKTLLEKYHVFKEKPYASDNCNELIKRALNSDYWSFCEGYFELRIVDLLLKHGAKPSLQTIKDIKYIYENEDLPHIKSLLKKHPNIRINEKDYTDCS